MRIPSLLLTLLVAASAHAEIFQCEVDGHKVFSQQPCGKDARSMAVEGEEEMLRVPEGDEVSEDFARRLCALSAKAWDRAGLSNRSAYESAGRDSGSSVQTVYNYISKHISNFEQLSRRDPNLRPSIYQAANAMNMLAKVYPNPTAAQIGDFTDSCTQGIMDHAPKKGGPSLKGAPSYKGQSQSATTRKGASGPTY